MPERELDPTEEESVTRSFWSGTISFGLVSIPVALYAANRPRGVSLRMVSPEGTPLTRRYFTSKDDRELDADEIVRGYEVEKDRFVLVDDEELERLAPERTRDIDLRQFVKAEDIDPMYFERAYYLTPTGGSNKAYRLLARVMEETGRAGVATFVMRAKEYLVAIIAENGILRAETLRFADELRTPEDVGLPEPGKAAPAAVKRIDQEIAKRLGKGLAKNDLVDHSAERMLKLVEKKRRAGDDVVHLEEAEREERPGVIDLMEVLKRRMEGIEDDEDSGAASRKRASSKSASSKRSPSKSTSSKSASGKSTSSKRAGSKSGAGKRGASSAAELRESSKAELLERAKALDIPGRSGMTKDELVKAIRSAAA